MKLSQFPRKIKYIQQRQTRPVERGLANHMCIATHVTIIASMSDSVMYPYHHRALHMYTLKEGLLTAHRALTNVCGYVGSSDRRQAQNHPMLLVHLYSSMSIPSCPNCLIPYLFPYLCIDLIHNHVCISLMERRILSDQNWKWKSANG